MSQSFDRVYSAEISTERQLSDVTLNQLNTGKFIYSNNTGSDLNFGCTIDLTNVKIGFNWNVYQSARNPDLPGGVPHYLSFVAPDGVAVEYTILINRPSVMSPTTLVTETIEDSIIGTGLPEELRPQINLAGIKLEIVVVDVVYDDDEQLTNIGLKIVEQEYAFNAII